MTADQVRLIIREKIGTGSQRAFAREIGLSPSYVNDVLNGLREPGGQLLDALDLRRVLDYQYKRNGGKPRTIDKARGRA